MKTFAKLAAAAALAVSFFAAPAQASDTRELLAHANATVTTLRHDSVFGDARRNLRGARAVLIFPSLVKGGFIFGAEGGDGEQCGQCAHRNRSPGHPALPNSAATDHRSSWRLRKDHHVPV